MFSCRDDHHSYVATDVLTTSPQPRMYSTQGIEAIATVTELRSKTSALIEQSKGLKTGIMIQKNNEPEAVLVSYDLYQKMHKALHGEKK